jgi:hypothetical protein
VDVGAAPRFTNRRRSPSNNTRSARRTGQKTSFRAWNASDGDVLRAEITGDTIRVYKNGSLVASVSDSTYATGQPGMGF